MEISIQNNQTYYQLIGRRDLPVLVMLHGWGCDWQVWAPVIPALSEYWQLLIPDIPGLGLSIPPVDDWSSWEYADWLIELVEKIIPRSQRGTASIILMGHSFGGKIEALTATHRPSWLSKLVLVAPAGLPLPLTAKERITQRLSQLLPKMIKQQLDSQLKSWVLKKLGVAVDYQQANSAQQQILRRVVRENIADDLAQIRVPTLIAWGAQDQTIPPDVGQRWQQLIPAAELEIFVHSGHYPFVDETSKFLELLTSFGEAK